MVFNAYVVAFGGLLLLGGRLSDLLGARCMFLAGWAVLAAGSLEAGLADSTGVEIAARAAQGAGAAFIAPSALTLLMMLFGGNPMPTGEAAGPPRRWSSVSSGSRGQRPEIWRRSLTR